MGWMPKYAATQSGRRLHFESLSIVAKSVHVRTNGVGEAIGPGDREVSCASEGVAIGEAVSAEVITAVTAAVGREEGGAMDPRSVGTGVVSKELHDTDRTDRTTRAVRRITFL
jgi:hypothetical protein